MQTAHIRNKLHLYGPKITAILALVFCMHTGAQAQKQQQLSWVKKNNPNYDNRKLSYGFLIGIHTTAYQLKYSDNFVTQNFDTVYAVEPKWSPGFSLGFIVNYRLDELWDLRLTPKVAFYEHKLRYLFTDDTKTDEQTVETTMVEFPLLLKFKSERRDNLRMYMIGGVKPAIEASGKKNLENVTATLEVTGANLSLDVGFGLDIYYPLFKFSPEVRFSRGIVNVLDNRTNKYGMPLERLNTNTITVYLLFQ
jgi:hypothetical protein